MMISSSSTPSIFVYGTLMSPAVVKVLLGHVPPHSPAVLSGFQRYPVIGQVYPGMISKDSGETRGLLMEAVSPSDLEVFDYFEGDEYKRELVTVQCNGRMQKAQTYVWSSPTSCLDLTNEWKFCDKTLEWYLEWTVRPCRKHLDELGIGK